MIAFAMFWFAAFAGLFFVLGLISKAVVEGLSALLMAVEDLIIIAIGAGLGIVLLTFIDIFGTAVIEHRVWDVIFSIIMFIAMIILLISIFGNIGIIILEFLFYSVVLIFDFIIFIFEGGAEICDKCYYYFLKAIEKRLERY